MDGTQMFETFSRILQCSQSIDLSLTQPIHSLLSQIDLELTTRERRFSATVMMLYSQLLNTLVIILFHSTPPPATTTALSTHFNRKRYKDKSDIYQNNGIYVYTTSVTKGKHKSQYISLTKSDHQLELIRDQNTEDQNSQTPATVVCQQLHQIAPDHSSSPR